MVNAMHINNNEPPINEGASTSRGSSGTESSGLLNVAEVAGGMRRSASKLLVWKSGKKESTSVGSSKNSSQDSGILLNKEDIGYIYDHIIQEIKEGKCEIWDDNFNQLVEKVLDDVDRKAREKLRQDRWNITSDDGSSLLTVAIERAEQNKDDDEYDIHIWNTIFLIHHYFQTNKTELIKGLKNFTNNQGKTLLHYAIESGNNEFLGAVINGLRSSISHDIKKEIDSKDENGKTPLHYAAELGNKEFFKLLVENGARFTDTIHCNSELHYAAESGKLDLLEYIKERLTKRGLFESEKSKKDANGDNALHYAAQSGSGECIKFLIDNCVQFSRNKHDENPLHRIANAKTVDEKAIDYFINDLKLAGRLRSAINRQDKDGNTPLHRAAECGNKLFIEKLIHLDADISIKNNKNNTPLHRAIIKGHSDCVRVFFDSYERSGKIIQETEGGYGRGLVHLAAMYGQYDCLEFLLGKFSNYDTNKETDLGNTALHLAVSGEGDKSLPDTEVQHRKACINLLIKKGTEVNRLNNEGNTPLHLAARFSDSRAELLKCVISNIRKKKIDLNNEIFHKNNDGDNAFHMAAHSGNRACLKYFFTHVKKNKNNKIPEILNKKITKERPYCI
ncbi:ankyrin repeat domain-containing protein [Wolbachia endosymbiont of Ctenocephalides felis wCfeT]|uniref:ankyrin repeat domain-containing protein n=1 Tax=Wolbachia endosymbiont of Ctenocephalides felis wCfeT TaxID=2732593 RepID=UPI001445EA99|nr:ankyrin repeat domain-containing protein [Wolbachia endosymbiont of Ctenocephalides felis wCfeT]